MNITDRSAGERVTLRVAALCGLTLTIGVDLLWLIGLFPAMDHGPWKWPLAILTCAIQTAVSVFGAIGFAWLHTKLRVNLWFAIPYGLVAGAVVGGISIGLAIGVRMWLGVEAGMITRIGMDIILVFAANCFADYSIDASGGIDSECRPWLFASTWLGVPNNGAGSDCCRDGLGRMVSLGCPQPAQ